MSTAVEYQSIVLNEQGQPVIAGTRFKVLVMIQDHLYWGLTAEQIIRQHEGLTLAQAYAALAYYYEHQGVLDIQLQQWNEQYEQLQKANQDSPIRRKLRTQGLIP